MVAFGHISDISDNFHRDSEALLAILARNSLKTVVFGVFPGFVGNARPIGIGMGFGNYLSKKCQKKWCSWPYQHPF